MPAAQRWRGEHKREWHWAQKGRSAERAVWVQTLFDQAAEARGLHSGAALLDLQKAFEHVPLGRVWRAGKKHGYPLGLLRMVLECCAFERKLTLRGAVAAGVHTLTAVAAGLAFATDCLQLAIMDIIDHLIVHHPIVRLCVYIDDITLHAIGTESEVTVELTAATRECIDGLEQVCMLVVDRDRPWKRTGKKKSVAVASSRALRQRLAASMCALGVAVKRKVKHLGIDYRPGCRRTSNVTQVQRWRAAIGRKERAKRLGQMGGAHVLRTGVVPAARYGASVSGVADGALQRLASAAAEVYGHARGRSTTARLAIRRADPRVGIVLKPLVEWTETIWRGDLPDHIVHDAWFSAQKAVGLSKRPHQSVTGGADAYIATLRRLSWKSPSPTTVITCDGDLFDLTKIEPRTIIEYAVADYNSISSARSSVAADFTDYDGLRGTYRTKEKVMVDGTIVEAPLGSSEHERKAIEVWRRGRYKYFEGRPVPWFLPAAAYLAESSRRCGGWSAGKASVASLVEGGWWPQARIHAANGSATRKCQRCMARVGTTWHRLGACSEPAAVAHRDDACPRWLLEQASVWAWNPLYARGVPAEPKQTPPPPQLTFWGDEGQPKDGAVATGSVYTDGALTSLFGLFGIARRAGWGVVSLCERGRVVWSKHGTLPERFPTVVRAELQAVLEALRLAVPPLTIHTDSQEVVDGFVRGEGWSTAPARSGASIWRQIWPILHELGPGVGIVKVRGHATADDVRAGRVQAVDYIGNSLADRAARRGSAAAEAASPTRALRMEVARAIRWYQWVAAYAAAWQSDTTEPEEHVAAVQAEKRRDGRRRPRDGVLPHVRWQLAGKQICRRCGREAVTPQAQASLRNSPCLGSAVGRVLARSGEDPSALERRCSISYLALWNMGARPLEGDEIERPQVSHEGLGDCTSESEADEAGFVEEGQLHEDLAQTAPPNSPGRHLHHHHPLPHHAYPPLPPVPPPDADDQGDAGHGDDDSHRDYASDDDPFGHGGSLDPPGREGLPPGSSTDVAAPLAEAGAGGREHDEGGEDAHDDARAAKRRRGLDESGDGQAGGAPRTLTAAPRVRLRAKTPTAVLSSVITGQWGHGHRIAYTANLAWCRLCGYYATRRVGIGLSRPCRGEPTRSYTTALRRLREGRHPRTGELIV